MGKRDTLRPGDEWPAHYRGFRLQVSPNEEVWWQLYNGTDRLRLEPTPSEVVDNLLDLKRIGGRIHVTEAGDVLTRLEESGDEESYQGVYVGSIELQGELVPEEDPEYSIDISPDGLSEGDLWPGVYDGSRYSFVGDHVWWHNSETHRRHPVTSPLPEDLQGTLERLKPKGGSFRITPNGDVITLVPAHPTPVKVEEQFSELPRVVRNIIRLRKERGDVEMLPVFVGTLSTTPMEVKEPKSLTDKMTPEERKSLESWASGLGKTNRRSSSDHQANSTDHSEDTSESESGSDETGDSDEAHPKEKLEEFDDDPMEWINSSSDEARSERGE